VNGSETEPEPMLIAVKLTAGKIQGFSYDVNTWRISIVLTGLQAVDNTKLNDYLEHQASQNNLGARGNVTSRTGGARFPKEA